MNYKVFLVLVILQLFSSVAIIAQVKTMLFEDKTMVETTPSKLPVVVQFELFEGLPQLQSKLSEFFFDEKNVSIKESYQHYLEKLKNKSMVNPNDPKEIVTGRLFELHKAFEKKGTFVCFEATKMETQSYAGHKSRSDVSICLMYDIIHDKVLTIDDIFIPNTAKYIKSRLDKGEVSCIFIDYGETDKVSTTIKDVLIGRKSYSNSTLPALHYGNRYQIKHMEFESNRKFFTSSFNELVNAVLKK
jgi:hypothetical protein